MKPILFIFICISSIFQIKAQTAQIKVERIFYTNSSLDFDSLIFYINGERITPFDTVYRNIKLNTDLDECKVIWRKDTTFFYAKFRSENNYNIKPGCCCATFTIEPEKNGSRGSITFKNTFIRDIGVEYCEHNIDTIIPKKTLTLEASESAMCLFKPCQIKIVETSYFSDEYEYNGDDKSYYKLWLERESKVIGKINFQFLHGERIELKWDENLKQLKIKF